eukprot:11233791-Karenia_brevis.AAC.1
MPAGIDSCSKDDLALWKSWEYCYAPYQFQRKYTINEVGGGRRPPNSRERELLMDFEGHHTATARRTGERKSKARELESVRCALVGNSFHCGVVAWLLSHWAQSAGFLDKVLTVQEMRSRPQTFSQGRQIQHKDLGEPDEEASILLVEEMSRRCTHRGSDVRLGTGSIFKPDSWPRKPINPE